MLESILSWRSSSSWSSVLLWLLRSLDWTCRSVHDEDIPVSCPPPPQQQPSTNCTSSSLKLNVKLCRTQITGSWCIISHKPGSDTTLNDGFHSVSHMTQQHFKVELLSSSCAEVKRFRLDSTAPHCTAHCNAPTSPL